MLLFFWCYISCDREAVLLESWMEIKILKKGTIWDIQSHGKDEKQVLWLLSGNKCHKWWLSYVCVRLTIWLVAISPLLPWAAAVPRRERVAWLWLMF